MNTNINRETFENVLSSLQNLEIYNIYGSAEFYEICLKYEMKKVEKDRHVDKHRWYELSETVYSLGEWFIGVYGVTQMYSESSEFADANVKVEFYELKLVEKTIYDYETMS